MSSNCLKRVSGWTGFQWMLRKRCPVRVVKINSASNWLKMVMLIPLLTLYTVYIIHCIFLAVAATSESRDWWKYINRSTVDNFQYFSECTVALCLKLQASLNAATPHANRNLGIFWGQTEWHHITYIKPMGISDFIKIRLDCVTSVCTDIHMAGIRMNFSVAGEISLWLAPKWNAALWRQHSFKSSWHMENIMVVSHQLQHLIWEWSY